MKQNLAFAGDNRTICLRGPKLVELRRAHAMSREQLSEASIGPHRLSVATIKRAESGAPVYLETARRLATLLGAGSVAALSVDENEQLGPPGVVDTAPVGVAVMPFRPIGPDAGGRVLASGMTEDLTTRLSASWFPVISYASVLGYGGVTEKEDPCVGLDVGYLVEGSVQHGDTKTRVHARLLEAGSRRILWTGEYNRIHGELLRLQDELTTGIVDAVNRRLLELHEDGRESGQARSVEAWQFLARGSQSFYRYSSSANTDAREFLQHAVNIDPSAAHAWYLLALTHQQDLLQSWTGDPGATMSALKEVSARFCRSCPGDPRSDVIAAYAHIYQGERGRARERLEHAVSNAANLHTAYALLGQTLAMAGDASGAFEQLEIALRLNPVGADVWALKTALALAHFVNEEYEPCIALAESAAELCPGAAFPLGTIAASAALTGDTVRARRAVARMVPADGRSTSSSFQFLVASTEPEIAVRYARGLALAGFSV